MAASNYKTRSTTITSRSPRRRLDVPETPSSGDLAASTLKDNPNRLMAPSHMLETHLGGVLEPVPGFAGNEAMSQGFGARHLDSNSALSPNWQLDPGAAGDLALKPQRRFNEGHRWTQVEDTASVPWRSICQLEMTYSDGRSAVGSGWFSAADTVITAGHNLYIPETGASAQQIRVVPGRNGQLGPFGETFGETFEVAQGWVDHGAPEHDYGMIKLVDKTIGTRTGWFGYAVFSDGDLAQSPLVQSAGYPNETRPFATQWYDAGRAKRMSDAFLSYRVDTEEGQSGAPVFFSNGQGQRWVVAIHVYNDALSNLGLRITDEIFRKIAGWSA
jgi:V8-like Glu-specific endopeptidase